MVYRRRRGVALVIGNAGGAAGAGSEPLSHRDARAVAVMLRDDAHVGAELVLDGTTDDMWEALLRVKDAVRSHGFVVVYFSGHGSEVGGDLWCHGVATDDPDEDESPFGLLQVNDVMHVIGEHVEGRGLKDVTVLMMFDCSRTPGEADGRVLRPRVRRFEAALAWRVCVRRVRVA